MDSATWICGAALILALFLRLYSTKKKNLPPGPWSWPLVGSLVWLRPNRHHALARLAKIHGPLMSIRFGVRHHLIVSSPEMARLVLKEHDLEFASRPLYHTLARLLSRNFQDLIFAPHGAHWKMMRRVSAVELFTSAKVSHFAGIRKAELAAFGKRVDREAALSATSGFNLSALLHEFFTDLMTGVLFGRKFYGDESEMTPEAEAYKASWAIQARETRRLFIGDYIPALRWLDVLRGTVRRFQNEILPARERFLRAVIEEHRKGHDPSNARDFVDVVLTLSGENKLTNDELMALIQDLLVAGTGTSKGTIEWAISEMVVNPEIQKKAQEELDRVVGRDRELDESDLKNLPYLQAIVKEVFRMHPIAATALPHYNERDVHLAGYTIPAHTTVLVNIWAIQHDPDVWEDPDRFHPERFVGSDCNVLGRDFDLLPFSSGRRRCVGMPLALPHVTLSLAYLLHRWQWSAPRNKPLDMSEMKGIAGGGGAVALPRILCATPRF